MCLQTCYRTILRRIVKRSATMLLVLGGSIDTCLRLRGVDKSTKRERENTHMFPVIRNVIHAYRSNKGADPRSVISAPVVPCLDG